MSSGPYHIAFLSPNRGQIGEAHVIPTLARSLAATGHKVDLLRVWREWEDIDVGMVDNPVRIASLGTRRLLPALPSVARVSSWANYRIQGALMAGAMMPGFVRYLNRERPDFLVARMQTMAAVIAKGLSIYFLCAV